MSMYVCMIIILLLINKSISTTSIRTYPTVDLKENVPINTNVIELIKQDQTNIPKLILLNLVGYETNLFEIKNGTSLRTINEIDREEFVDKKRCFNRLKCLIELHILVNDGEEYWIIPIHILDENDNKPEFKRSSIDMKINENEINEYKIPFEGAIDSDEDMHSQISYILDCSSSTKQQTKINLTNENKRLVDCFPLFDLMIFSQTSLINQYDQLGLIFNNLSLSYQNQYQLILYAFNYDRNNTNLLNSMIINVKIEQLLRKPKFLLSEYRFVIKSKHQVKNGEVIGRIQSISSDKNKRLTYRIRNNSSSSSSSSSSFAINSFTGDLYLINATNVENIKSEINLLVESSYEINPNIKSRINVRVLVRLFDQLEHLHIEYQIQSPIIKQIPNKSNDFYFIKSQRQNIISSNEIFLLFSFSIVSLDYPSDVLIVELLNYQSRFSLMPSLEHRNVYLLKYLHNNTSEDELSSSYLLTLQIKHQLTNHYLSNLTIRFIPTNDDASMLSSNQSLRVCMNNQTYDLYARNGRNHLGKGKVIENNDNVLIFDEYYYSKQNVNEIIINDCRMILDMDQDVNMDMNETEYVVCLSSSLSSSNECYNISMNENKSKIVMKGFGLKEMLQIRSMEVILFSLLFVFVCGTITLVYVICRLRGGVSICLSIKNYLFYGKKYGLNNTKRMSSNKITERVHSIVVRESRSPSIDHIKSIEPYIYNISRYLEGERVSSMNLYGESSPHVSSTLSRSSNEREDRTMSNDNNEMMGPISSGNVQDNNQLLDMLSSNDDLNKCKLASEV